MNPATNSTPDSTRDSTPDRDLRRLAKRRVDLKMGFFTHLLVYVCVNTGLFFIDRMGGGVGWSLFPLLGWGLGLAIHGLVTWIQLAGGDGWRSRMVEQEMQRLKERRP
jgi:hypothetical protein